MAARTSLRASLCLKQNSALIVIRQSSKTVQTTWLLSVSLGLSFNVIYTTSNQPAFHPSLTHWLHSVHLHAQLSRITAIVRLCYSIRQLQLSEYTCRWENWIIGRSMSYPSTIGGTVPFQLVLTEPPPADLFTSPAASAFKKDGVRRVRRSYIFVHFVWGTW